MSPTNTLVEVVEDSADLAETRGSRELYRDYAAWLRAALRHRFGADAADDLVQETYLRVTRNDTAAIRHPRAFLMRIAINVARDWARRRRVEVDPPAKEAMIAALPVDASQHQAILLKQIVLALPPELRDVFVLNHIEGLTLQEIAQLRGMSVRTVERRMSAAMLAAAAALRQ